MGKIQIFLFGQNTNNRFTICPDDHTQLAGYIRQSFCNLFASKQQLQCSQNTGRYDHFFRRNVGSLLEQAGVVLYLQDIFAILPWDDVCDFAVWQDCRPVFLGEIKIIFVQGVFRAVLTSRETFTTEITTGP